MHTHTDARPFYGTVSPDRPLTRDALKALLRAGFVPRLAGADDGDGQGGNGDDGSAPKFTQADVDRIVSQRLARDRGDRPSDDELQNLRDAAARLKDIESQGQSDVEKLTTRIAELEQQSTSAIEGKKNADAALHAALKRAAVISAAAGIDERLVSPQQAAQLFPLDKLTVGDDGQTIDVDWGNPEVKDVGGAVKAFLESENLLGAPGRRTGPGDGGAGGGSAADDGGDDLPKAIAKAMSEGDMKKVSELNARLLIQNQKKE